MCCHVWYWRIRRISILLMNPLQRRTLSLTVMGSVIAIVIMLILAMLHVTLTVFFLVSTTYVVVSMIPVTLYLRRYARTIADARDPEPSGSQPPTSPTSDWIRPLLAGAMTIAAGTVWLLLGLSILKSNYFLVVSATTIIVGCGDVALALLMRRGAARGSHLWCVYVCSALVVFLTTYHGIVLIAVG